MDTRKRIVLGRISGLYGVKGWVKIHSHTDPRENIVKYSPWLLETREGWHEQEVSSGRRHGKTVVAKLNGVEDRDAAKTLIGTNIAIYRDQLPPARAGEYYWIDLEGLTVKTLEGQTLGKVEHLLETGANDVLVVKGDRERLIPLVEPDYVKDVDFDARVITVDWDPEF